MAQYLKRTMLSQVFCFLLVVDLVLATRSPIVFVPGDGGSQMEAKLNKSSRVHYVCDLTSDWYDIWLNIHLLTPISIDCLIDNMRLVYDATTHTTSDSPGVHVRPTNFGSLDSVDYLDIVHVPGTTYFDTIIQALKTNNGYEPNVNMVGAPFDFRKAPNELGEFFKNFTLLIESQYILNNYQPVTIICHSMGCLNTLYLLNHKTQTWKDIFVRRIISLAAPWSGSVRAISAMLYGDDLGIPLLSKAKLQSLQCTLPSLMYLFPREPTFDPRDLLVATSINNYSLKNFDEMFTEANMLDQRSMWHDTRPIAGNLSAPNVELWCLYGHNINTTRQVVYQGSILGNKYREIYGDGDGSVNIESLEACSLFKSQQNQPVYIQSFENMDHIDILKKDSVAKFISQQILNGEG